MMATVLAEEALENSAGADLIRLVSVHDLESGVEQVRRLVLQLAVRGRLGQGPAHHDGGRSDAITCVEGAWRLPSHWKWIPLEASFDALSTQGKKVLVSKVAKTGAYPVVDQGKVLIRGYTDEASAVIRPERPVVVFGDHTREVKYIDFAFVAGADGTKILVPKPFIDSRYFYWCVRSFDVAARGYGRHYSRLLKQPFPLPPLPEQKRIVAKVDQLMALCDELEAQQAKKRAVGDRLSKAALGALAAAEGPEEFEAAWTTVASNFEKCAGSVSAVGDLKRTLLDLAAKGRLAHGHGSDRPVSQQDLDELKKRFQCGTRRRLEPEGCPTPPSPLPAGWAWFRLDDMAWRVEYGTSAKPTNDRSGIRLLRMGNIQNGKISFDSIKYVAPNPEELDGLMLKPGDILFNRTNSYELVGKAGTFPSGTQGFTFASYLIRVSLVLDGDYPEFVTNYLNSPWCRETQIEPGVVQQNGQANFNGTKLRSVWVPVPPAGQAEQTMKRLRALLRLCDELEARLRGNETASTKLASALASSAVG